MSQLTWIRGPVCGINNCRSRLYKAYAGRKICQYGHVVEGNVEFGEDDGEAYTQTRRINLLINDTGFGSSVSTSALPSLSLTPTIPSRLYGRDARALYYKASQHILQKLLPLLAKELCPGDHEFLHNASLLTKVFWVRYCKKFHELTSPTILDLYVLIFLAMRKLNQHPVYVDDFIALIRKNKVPYINGASLVPASYLRQLHLAKNRLSGTSIPIDNQFYLRLILLALVVGTTEDWRTPLDYFYPGAFRVFIDLRFRDTPCLLTMFHRIGHRITDGRFQALWINFMFTPETQYVALLLLVIKVYFASAPEVPQLEEWILLMRKQYSEIPCFDDKHHKMDTMAVLDLSKEETAKYFDWIRNNLIPENRKLAEADEIPMTTKKLYKIFPIDESLSFTEDNSSQKPTFVALVKNTLTALEIWKMEDELRKYFCFRFGYSYQSLQEAYERLDKKFYRVLRSDGAVIN